MLTITATLPSASAPLHGLAGSLHLVGVIPALALPSRTAIAGYLCGYGIGSITAMLLLAAAVGRASRSAQARGGRIHEHLMVAAGAAALVVGAFWIAR